MKNFIKKIKQINITVALGLMFVAGIATSKEPTGYSQTQHPLLPICAEYAPVSIEAKQIVRLKPQIMVFYNEKGFWAETFTMAEILAVRLEPIVENTGDSLQATQKIHVHYRYEPIPNNAQDRQDSGEDKRVFTLERRPHQNWEVISMDDYGSGNLSEANCDR